MAKSSAYVLGGSSVEQQRLLLQSLAFEKEARWLLDKLDIQTGWRVIDMGCGPIGILDLLAERVGANGTVLGLEREPRFAEMAREIVSTRKLTNIEIADGDVNMPGLPSDSFNLAHERLVLINQPDPHRMLSEMVRIVRPGGIVAVQDVDQISWCCEPPHLAWNELLRAFQTVFSKNAGDLFIGRRLPGLLRSVGLN
jgi:ubiquinone/menaquinone biosynthesis C-methylase UbiE